MMSSIKYETFYWIIFYSLSIITIVDRFTMNLWSMGIDNPPFDGPWTVRVFDIVARASGRLTIITTNVMFLTQCRVIANIIAEYAPRWLIIDDIQETHKKIHSQVGKYWVAIPILLHVWSILLPWVFGVNLKVFSTRPKGTPFYDNNEVNLAHNDIYRLILMTLLFAVIIPLSLSRLRHQRYNLCRILHVFGGLMFTIDLLRMPSHPHSHVFNTPIVVIWVMDRIISHYFYKVHTVDIVKKINLDEKYAIVLLKYPKKMDIGVGDKFLYSFEKAREYAHCFTTFQQFDIPELSYNRPSCSRHVIQMNNNHLVNVSLGDNALDSIAEKWDTGIIVHKYSQEWTETLMHKDTLVSYGAYKSIYSTIPDNFDKPLVLIGTGAGGGYLLDCLRYIFDNGNIPKSVKIIYSTRSLPLFQFMNDIFSKYDGIPSVSIETYLTSNDHLETDPEYGINLSRIDLDGTLERVNMKSLVYFCGSDCIHTKLTEICRKYRLKFKKSHIIA